MREISMQPRIMAVDDSEVAQEVIRASLNDIGFDDIVVLTNPVEALERIRTGDVTADITLMDIFMPEMNGIELCAKVRSVPEWADVPIIMLTSQKQVSYLSKAFMAGANDYLTKPFQREELHARIRNCLRLKSELDRRRVLENGRSSRPRARIHQSVIPEIFGSQDGFRANIHAMQVAEQEKLGIIVFRIDDPQDGQEEDLVRRQAVRRQVADVLGDVQVPASEALSHWEEDIFCLALPNASTDILQERAQSFIDRVIAARLKRGGVLSRQLVTISAVIAPPGGSSASASLVNAIKKADTASEGDPRGSIAWIDRAAAGGPQR